MSERLAPRRRVQIKIDLGADSWEEAARALGQMETDMLRGGLRTRGASGGWGCGYHYEASEDESVTHDSYVKAVEEWLAAERTALPTPDCEEPSE